MHEPAVSIIKDDTELVADPTARRRFRTVIAAVAIAGAIISITALAITRPSASRAASTVVLDMSLDSDMSHDEIDEMLQWFDAEPAVIDQRIVIALPFDRLRITTYIRSVTILVLVADMAAAAAVRRLVMDRYPGPNPMISEISTMWGDMTNPVRGPFVPNQSEIKSA